MSRMCSSKSSGSGGGEVLRAMPVIVVRRPKGPAGARRTADPEGLPDGRFRCMSATEATGRSARQAAYPRHWEADVLLRDGRAAHLRPITDEDEQLLVDF